MFGIGLPEMIVILAVALIVVGPDKLPELARSLAKGVNELKNTMNQVKESLTEETKIVSSVQQDLQQTAGQMKTHLLEDVTKNPNQWKREGDTTAASSGSSEEDDEIVEVESLTPRPWEEEAAVDQEMESVTVGVESSAGEEENTPEQPELAEADAGNLPKSGVDKSDDDDPVPTPSSVA